MNVFEASSESNLARAEGLACRCLVTDGMEQLVGARSPPGCPPAEMCSRAAGTTTILKLL